MNYINFCSLVMYFKLLTTRLWLTLFIFYLINNNLHTSFITNNNNVVACVPK